MRRWVLYERISSAFSLVQERLRLRSSTTWQNRTGQFFEGMLRRRGSSSRAHIHVGSRQRGRWIVAIIGSCGEMLMAQHLDRSCFSRVLGPGTAEMIKDKREWGTEFMGVPVLRFIAQRPSLNCGDTDGPFLREIIDYDAVVHDETAGSRYMPAAVKTQIMDHLTSAGTSPSTIDEF